MNLYNALEQMRKLSEAREPFSMMFMSYSRSRQSSHGIVQVDRARIKPRAKAAKYQHADIIDEYIDLSTGEGKKFYQCTLLFFNGHKIKLS